MPSDLSYWLISAPLKDGDPNLMLDEVRRTLGASVQVSGWEIPELKVGRDSNDRNTLIRGIQAGTLSNLLSFSDSLPKLDSAFTQTVSKLLDTLRSLLADEPGKLAQHARVNDRTVEDYLMPGNTFWGWDKRRWGSGGKVADVVDALTKVCFGSL